MEWILKLSNFELYLIFVIVSACGTICGAVLVYIFVTRKEE